MANPVDQLGEQLDALAAIVADVLTSAVSAAAAATQKFAAGLSALTGSVTNLATGPLAVVAETLTATVNKVGSALTTLAAGPASAFGVSVGAAADKVGQLAVAVAQLGAGPISALAASINQSLVVPFANLSGALGSLISGPFGAARDQVLNVTQGLAGLVGGMAGFKDAVLAVPAAMAPFVAALAPGLLNQFNYAAASLSATIGSALAPAFQVLIGVVNTVAGQIAPVTHLLAPVLAQFAQIIGSIVVPIVQVMAAALEAMMPLFQFLADVLRGLVPLFQAMGVVVSAMITTVGNLLKSFFGGADAKNAMDGFRNAIEMVAKQLVLLSVRLAAMFGDLPGKHGYIDNVTEALVKQINAAKGNLKGDAPAPTGAGTSSLESIGQQISSLAFLAGGGPAPDDHPEVAVLENILDSVKQIDQASLGAVIYKAADDLWEKIILPWLKEHLNLKPSDSPLSPWWGWKIPQKDI